MFGSKRGDFRVVFCGGPGTLPMAPGRASPGFPARGVGVVALLQELLLLLLQIFLGVVALSLANVDPRLPAAWFQEQEAFYR